MDLYIRVVDHKFITGIYHKVDDFNFEVISYPFPQSNVHSMLGYSTYYSQLIRFFRLCNNINDFLFRAKFSYSKLVKRGYKHKLLLKYFKKFCSAYNVEGKYGEKNSDLLFSRMLKHNPFVSCNINNTKEINDIVKASCVKIMPLTRSVECEWLNKSPLPTNVSDTVNAPLPYTLDIDESGGNNSCSLSDVAKCSIILDKNTPPSEFLPEYNTVYTSVDTRVFSQSHPLPLIIEHKHPFGNKNTRHIESSYILQPPKYLLLFVNRFRYLNNNIIKDRCPIPLDATVMLGPLKFNLQATIDHHGPSIDSGHYTASINCCKKTFYCNDHKITEFGITDKNTSTAYIVLYKWIDTWFLDSDRRVGVWSLPWRWHILSIPLTTGRGTSAETCGLDDVFPPDDLGSRPETLC